MNYQSTKAEFDIFLNNQAQIFFGEENPLNSAIKYSLLAEGKRIRPLLVHAFSQIIKGDQPMAQICGMAVEMIHTYSLIHDDLPAMDNDDFRRGMPTNHKVFGEAVAILAGDALLNFAPEYLIQELNAKGFSDKKNLFLVSELLKSSGHLGMVKGQVLDLEFENKDLSTFSKDELLVHLENIHRLKTGAIIKWSCLAGLMSSSDENLIQNFSQTVSNLGSQIGLLFQIVDDYIDSNASFKDIGKTPGKDEKKGKLTYVTLLGDVGTKAKALELIGEIRNKIRDFKDKTILEEIILSLEKKLN
jgi:geranylgeranyl diphosphate synthase type II